MQSDHNGAVESPGTERLLEATRGLFSDRALQFGLIVAIALVATYEATLPHAQADATGATVFVLNVLAIGPLIIALRWPALAAAASTLVTVVVLHTYQAPLAVASFCVSVFLIAHLVTRRGLFFAMPLLLPFVVFAAMRPIEGHSLLASTAPLLFLIAALVVGESIRRRRIAVAALDATKDEMAERVRAQTAMEERARIARELHDIVAHHLSVIAIESEATRLTTPGLSPDVGGRLESIASTAREALAETRRLLGVLREDTRGAADRAPQPGLEELDELITRARATGTNINLVRRGKIAQLPRSTDLAAYRIVQEALTNARRHAPRADVDIELSFRPDAIHLRVRDHGPALAAEPVAGHGLMGMRERATLAGGTFSSAIAEEGGFVVDATLPAAETPS
jgi:signal transduction histidine kinase